MKRARNWMLVLAAWAVVLPTARAQEPSLLAPPKSALEMVVRGQDYSQPDPNFPLPIGHDRMDKGGFYTALEFLFFQETNPLESQVVGRRGIIDVDGSIAGVPGRFIGSRRPAISTDDLGGVNFTPGYNVALGWKFRNDLTVEFDYMHLEEAKYTALASIIPADFRLGVNFVDTFLSAPVSNFPIEFAGPDFDVAVGNAAATFGIWSAASLMEISFTQRFDQWQFVARMPVYENDDVRYYCLVGPRAVSIWERFRWRTVDLPLDASLAGPQDVGIYSNVVSNRLYGFHFGVGDECRLADTSIGTFAVNIDVEAAFFVNFIKTRSKYELGDRSIAVHRTRRLSTLVPELQAQANLWWYPIEGVQLRLGYNAMSFFNTIAAPQPVDFNFGSLSPDLENVTRFFHGLNAGIAIIF